MGLRFRKHQRPIESLRCNADVVFPRERIAVFVDGCFWHGCPEHGRAPRRNSNYWREKLDRNAARDRRNTKALADAGWVVLRYWEHEPVPVVADEVRRKVQTRRATLVSQ
jgi:DNA mismatch endonuclease (patch repair protein)